MSAIYGIPGHVWELDAAKLTAAMVRSTPPAASDGVRRPTVPSGAAYIDMEAADPWLGCRRCGAPYPGRAGVMPAHCPPTAEWLARHPGDDGACHCAEHDPPAPPPSMSEATSIHTAGWLAELGDLYQLQDHDAPTVVQEAVAGRIAEIVALLASSPGQGNLPAPSADAPLG
jgi:hypothetical protein